MIQGIVLDAHGVMVRPVSRAGDWLYRFVQQAGGEQDPQRIRRHYIEASLGRLPADAYWQAVGLTPAHETAYLDGIERMPGLEAFFARAQAAGLPVWCLSNDVGRWSDTLRQRHALHRHLQGWLISDAVQLRKPDPAIYRRFLEQFQLQPKGLLFVDDRLDNVEAARGVGFQAIQFREPAGFDALATAVWGEGLLTEQTQRTL